MGVASGRQSLNEPAMATDTASESENSMQTVCVPGRLGSAFSFFVVEFDFFFLNVLINLGFELSVSWNESNNPVLTRGPFR
jgi:hypothetical protein